MTTIRLKSNLIKFVVMGLVGGGLTLFGQGDAQEQKAGHLYQEKTATESEIDRKITCITDKKDYKQGDEVNITVTNVSDDIVFVIDRKHVDAGVATIEKKDAKGAWQAIELFAAAAVSVSKVLKPGHSHVYIWKTIGYNGSDTIADLGTYRILFGYETYTNQFEIQE
jgi:hypothetical protein